MDEQDGKGNCENIALHYAKKCEDFEEQIKELEIENDKFKDALVRIDNWAKAYPLDVFLKPDLKKAAKVLKTAGMTLDAISADAMRHVINGVKDITKKALKG